MSGPYPASPASPMSADALAGPEDPFAPGMATVATFNSVIEAELAKARLESENIFSIVVDGATASVAPHLSLAIGGIRLQTGERDLEEAGLILEEDVSQQTDGGITFRVVSDSSVLGGLAGLLAGGLGAGFFMVAIEPLILLMTVSILTGAGFVVGRTQRSGWCTKFGCAHALSDTDKVCPRCHCEVVETLARAENRLEAEERVLLERSTETRL